MPAVVSPDAQGGSGALPPPPYPRPAYSSSKQPPEHRRPGRPLTVNYVHGVAGASGWQPDLVQSLVLQREVRTFSTARVGPPSPSLS